MRLLVAALLALALPVLAHGQGAPARTYTVTWTARTIHRGWTFTGKGKVTIWTYRALRPDGTVPPLPQTRVYDLPIPPECKGRTTCTLATLPLPDPSIMKRVIVSTHATGADTHIDVRARVTVLKPPETY